MTLAKERNHTELKKFFADHLGQIQKDSGTLFAPQSSFLDTALATIDNKQPGASAKVAEIYKMMNEFEIPEVKKCFAEHRDQTKQDTRAVLNEK
jgi:hypothetical protein